MGQADRHDLAVPGFARFLEPPRLRTIESGDGDRRATWLVAAALATQVVVELSGHEQHVAPDTSPAPGTS